MKSSKFVILSAVLVVLLSSSQVRCYPPSRYSGCEVKVYHADSKHCELTIQCGDKTIICGGSVTKMGELDMDIPKL